MALPVSDEKSAWPPKDMAEIFDTIAKWNAWYANDLAMLQAAYGGGLPADPTGFYASDAGGFKAGVARTLQRWFIALTPSPGVEPNTKTPVPITSEICRASADLLFSDPITVDGLDGATQVRVDEILDDAFHTTIAEAAEMAAALGGTYLRVTWDDGTFVDRPFTTVKDADQALPEFKWGRLSAVTFWSVIYRTESIVYRHLERHELDSFGVGVIRHGLYQGDEGTLGIQVSLGTLPATESLAKHVDLDAEGTLTTASPGLAVEYVPNQTPNRMWRKHAVGKNLGHADIDGSEHLIDQLAETISDWMRARRAARARVMMAKSLTKTAGPGQGRIVNTDQEVYTTVEFSAGSGGQDMKLSDQVQVLQPTFNPEEFKTTADDLVERILQMAGYSQQTFGVGEAQGGQRTATEIESKERRSLMTRARKIRTWRPALERHLTKLLLVDNAVFHKANNPNGIHVEFSDGVQESQLHLAQTVQALYASESASVEERVEIMHPDWDDGQKEIEVGRIKAEFAQPQAGHVPPDFGPPLPDEAPETP